MSRRVFSACIGGTLTAAVVSFLTLRFLFLMVRKRDPGSFGYYCWSLGILTLAVTAFF